MKCLKCGCDVEVEMIKCSTCGEVYDVNYGLQCPRCGAAFQGVYCEDCYNSLTSGGANIQQSYNLNNRQYNNQNNQQYNNQNNRQYNNQNNQQYNNQNNQQYNNQNNQQYNNQNNQQYNNQNNQQYNSQNNQQYNNQNNQQYNNQNNQQYNNQNNQQYDNQNNQQYNNWNAQQFNNYNQSNTYNDWRITQLSTKLKTNAIIWICIAAVQILLGVWVSWWTLIVGVLNLISGINGLKYSDTILTSPFGIVKKYEPLTLPIITLVYNLIFGGVIGVIGSIYYLAGIRYFVIVNKDYFNMLDSQRNL